MSRKARRRRGKRAARREAIASIGKMVELGRQGFSSSTIAGTVLVSEAAVEKILSMLEVSVGEGGGEA